MNIKHNCDLIILVLSAFIIYTSPLNTHSMYKEKLKRIPNKFFLVMSISLACLIIISDFYPIPYIDITVITLMILSICYSFVIGYFDETKNIKNVIKKSVIFWSICLISFILSVVFDFYELFKDLNFSLIDQFSYLPAFYTLLNIGLINKLRTLQQSIPVEIMIKLSSFKLTRRELEVISLLLDGKRNMDISSSLSISISTVKKHISNIYRKTDTKNIAEFLSLINSN